MRKHYSAILREENHLPFVLGLRKLEKECNVAIEENAELNYLSNSFENILDEKLEKITFKKATGADIKNVGVDVTFELDNFNSVFPSYYFVADVTLYENENILAKTRVSSSVRESVNLEDFANAFLKSLKEFEEKHLEAQNER